MSKINIWEKQKKDLYVRCNTNKKNYEIFMKRSNKTIIQILSKFLS